MDSRFPAIKDRYDGIIDEHMRLTNMCRDSINILERLWAIEGLLIVMPFGVPTEEALLTHVKNIYRRLSDKTFVENLVATYTGIRARDNGTFRLIDTIGLSIHKVARLQEFNAFPAFLTKMETKMRMEDLFDILRGTSSVSSAGLTDTMQKKIAFFIHNVYKKVCGFHSVFLPTIHRLA